MEDYITVVQAADKWGVFVRTVQSLCAKGKIAGASKMSNEWIIPKDVDYPLDHRIKNSKYVNWRNKATEKEAL